MNANIVSAPRQQPKLKEVGGEPGPSLESTNVQLSETLPSPHPNRSTGSFSPVGDVTAFDVSSDMPAFPPSLDLERSKSLPLPASDNFEFETSTSAYSKFLSAHIIEPGSARNRIPDHNSRHLSGSRPRAAGLIAGPGHVTSPSERIHQHSDFRRREQIEGGIDRLERHELQSPSSGLGMYGSNPPPLSFRRNKKDISINISATSSARPTLVRSSSVLTPKDINEWWKADEALMLDGDEHKSSHSFCFPTAPGEGDDTSQIDESIRVLENEMSLLNQEHKKTVAGFQEKERQLKMMLQTNAGNVEKEERSYQKKRQSLKDRIENLRLEKLNTWDCEACTFRNPASADSCKICRTRKPIETQDHTSSYPGHDISSEKLCDVCKFRERNTIILSCGHFKYCGVCISRRTTCPTCGADAGKGLTKRVLS